MGVKIKEKDGLAENGDLGLYDPEGYAFVPKTPKLIEAADKLNSFLRNFSPEQIEAIVEELTAETGRKKRDVLNILGATSHFGRPENLQALNATIVDFIHKGYSLYVPQEATLGDTIKYLSTKKRFFGPDGVIEDQNCTGSLGPMSLIVLDYTFIENLKNPDFAKDLAKFSDTIAIIDPIGLCDGVSVFQISGPRSLKTKLRTLLDIVPPEAATSEAAVEHFLKDRAPTLIRAALAELSIDPDKAPLTTPITGDFFRNNPKQDQIARIVDSLNPKEITEDTLGRNLVAMLGSDEGVVNLMCDYIASNAIYFSPRRVVSRLREMHSQILAIASQYQCTAKDIIFVVPESGRSHDLMTFIYRAVNNCFENPAISVIQARELLKEKGEGRFIPPGRKIFVSIDDMAVTGTTGRKAYSMAREVIPKKYPVVWATIAATDRSIEGKSSNLAPDDPDAELTSRVSTLRESQIKDKNFHIVRLETLAPLPETLYYQSLPPERQDELIKYLGTPGYGGQNISAATWYMIPNTCPSFIAEHVLVHLSPATTLKERKLRKEDFVSFRNYQLSWAKKVESDMLGMDMKQLRTLVDNLLYIKELAKKKFPHLLSKDDILLIDGVNWVYEERKKEVTAARNGR